MNTDTTAPTTGQITYRKGGFDGDRYEVDLDGVRIGWIVRPTEYRKTWIAYVPEALASGRRVGESTTRKEATIDLALETRFNSADPDQAAAATTAYRQLLGIDR